MNAANPYMDMALTAELRRLRQKQVTADTSKGMAWVYHDDTNIGLFTVAFAESWCKDDPAYKWERAQ